MAVVRSCLRLGVILQRAGCLRPSGVSYQLSKGPILSASLQSQLGYQISPTWCIWRGYAKKMKLKGKKDNKAKPKMELSEDEISQVIDLPRYREKMQTVTEELKQDFLHNLSLRTSAGSFDLLMVETEDGAFPLNQLGQIVQKSPQLLLINLAMSAKYIPAVKKALETSGMNIQPQQEATTLIVPIPKVSREHREHLAKSAKTLCNEAKEKLKALYNKAMKEIKREEENVSEDLRHNVEALVLATLHEYNATLDELTKQKKDELLQEKR